MVLWVRCSQDWTGEKKWVLVDSNNWITRFKRILSFKYSSHFVTTVCNILPGILFTHCITFFNNSCIWLIQETLGRHTTYHKIRFWFKRWSTLSVLLQWTTTHFQMYPFKVLPVFPNFYPEWVTIPFNVICYENGT